MTLFEEIVEKCPMQCDVCEEGVMYPLYGGPILGSDMLVCNNSDCLAEVVFTTSTDLKDKKGKRIFEGDVVQCFELRNDCCHKTHNRVVMRENNGGYLLDKISDYGGTLDEFTVDEELEVIGNVHDNTELLEGGAEGTTHMKILKTQDELYDEVIHQSTLSKTCLVSTFGLWAGVKADGTDWNASFPTRSNDALMALARLKTKILVGSPRLIECKPDCPDCKRRWEEQVKRIPATLTPRHIPFKVIEDNHSKFYVFDNCVIIGGMNLTTSQWSDYMFLIKDRKLTKELRSEFNKLWKTGT